MSWWSQTDYLDDHGDPSYVRLQRAACTIRRSFTCMLVPENRQIALSLLASKPHSRAMRLVLQIGMGDRDVLSITA
jgi:hypothetical protein